MNAHSAMSLALSGRFYRTADAASFLSEAHGIPVAPRTLAKLRVVGGGPAFHKFGRSVVYGSSDLVTWAQGRLGNKLASTSATVSSSAKKSRTT